MCRRSFDSRRLQIRQSTLVYKANPTILWMDKILNHLETTANGWFRGKLFPGCLLPVRNGVRPHYHRVRLQSPVRGDFLIRFPSSASWVYRFHLPWHPLVPILRDSMFRRGTLSHHLRRNPTAFRTSQVVAPLSSAENWVLELNR